LVLWWHSGGIPESVEATAGSSAGLCSQGGAGRSFSAWVFGGFYIVPLYVDPVAHPEERARVIAANNILNALFMVVSAIVSIVLLSLVKLSIPAAVPGGVAAEHRRQRLHLQIVPEFTMRFMIWLLSHSMYRVEHRNLELIPDEGAALLVCNHVSFVDALLIGGGASADSLRHVLQDLQPAGAEFHLSHGRDNSDRRAQRRHPDL
jgi:hypothetical protein